MPATTGTLCSLWTSGLGVVGMTRLSGWIADELAPGELDARADLHGDLPSSWLFSSSRAELASPVRRVMLIDGSGCACVGGMASARLPCIRLRTARETAYSLWAALLPAEGERAKIPWRRVPMLIRAPTVTSSATRMMSAEAVKATSSAAASTAIGSVSIATASPLCTRSSDSVLDCFITRLAPSSGSRTERRTISTAETATTKKEPMVSSMTL
mmetsp:Transcript_10297/g.31615  ORF Transcript_10297/g.31615 Transcript_10297/m.31615 type:complete len:214 (-) Transcript_10297:665-1306(-)|eukprot:scaffold252154_cov32-Tisochrysis_lutea.AAC.2